MTFTVAELLAIKDLSLTLVAGGQGVGRPIRWAHVSELDDPTPFLRGGEVLLSTGMSLRGSGPERQARFVKQLAAAELAAFGFGLGFGFEATPPAVVEAADRALDLSKAQAVANTERRLVGDFLDALLEGQLSGQEVRRRLRFLGLGEARPVAVLVGRPEETPGAVGGANGSARGDDHALEALRRLVEDRLLRQPGPYVCNLHDGAIVALLEAADLAAARATAESVALGARSRGMEARFGLGVPEVDPDGLRRRYQEARFALGTAAVAGALGPVVTVDDLGSHRLLLALQEDVALEAFARGLLGPIRAYDDRQHGELVHSLRVFLDHNGNWESAARALSVYRHTLRYRIRRIAELTGRNLDLAADRVEFWLALKAAEVLVGRRTAER